VKYLLVFLFLTIPAFGQSANRRDVQRLARYAKAHHLRWRVVCLSTADDPNYLGWAIHDNAKFALYVESGAKSDWTATATSQAGAVRKLLYAISHEPPSPAKHEPKEENKAAHCLRELNSENYTQLSKPCKSCGQ